MLDLMQPKISNQFKCSKRTIYYVKKFEVFERKQRSDAGKSRSIDENLGKISKKRLYGKKGVGLKKLVSEYNLSSKNIRRWLDSKPWGKYRIPKFEIGLSEKNLKDRKTFYKRVMRFGLNNVCKNVAFSDEMPARFNLTYNKQNQGMRIEKCFEKKFVKFKNPGVTLHVWAFISGKGSSKLYFLDENFELVLLNIAKS